MDSQPRILRDDRRFAESYFRIGVPGFEGDMEITVEVDWFDGFFKRNDRFAGNWTTWNTEMQEQFATLLVGRDITDYNTAMAAINSGDTEKINAWQNTLYPDRGTSATERQTEQGT